MLTTNIYNTFINRYLLGEIPTTFECYAYLMNSKYSNLPDTKYYLSNVNEFDKLSANSLKVVGNTLSGDCLCTGTYFENTYYRELDISDETTQNDPLIITDLNFSAISGMLPSEDPNLNKYHTYLKNFGFFYAVRRNDEFARLINICKNKEHFVVVLLDDIDNVVVNGNAFGTSQEHPFRGVFDGNGYDLHISRINANTESNGLFGYIAEEGVVSAVNILQTVDSSYLTVHSTTEISLNTIKHGKGDVKYGVLAGTNYGTIKNVTLKANILYDGNFRPDVYFVQNKQGSDSFISDDWARINASASETTELWEINGYPLTAASALQDYTNFCYPTQLCLNNEANCVPYVGYFNEGSFNDYYAYKNSIICRANALMKWGNNDDACYGEDDKPFRISADSQNYMADIYSLYLDKHPKTSKYYRDSFAKRTWLNHLIAANGEWEYYSDYTIDGKVINRAQGTFRLGPNDKAAYLIGNLVGFNAGNIQSAAAVTTATFNSNTVALIGGLAGRAAAGYIDDTYVCTTFVGTSGLFTDYIKVKDTTTMTAEVLVNPVDAVKDNLSYITPISARNSTNSIIHTNLKFEDLAQMLSANNVVLSYVSELRNTICRAYVQNEVDSKVSHISDLYSISYSGSNLGTGHTITAQTEDAQTTFTLNVKDFYISNTIAAIDNYESSCNFGHILNTQNSYSAISAVDLASNTVELVNPVEANMYYEYDPYITFIYTNVFTANGTTAESEEFIVEIPISKYAQIGVSAETTNSTSERKHPITIPFVQNLSTQQILYPDTVTLLLYPVLNIGGMFGEYVYSNRQRITKSRSEIYAKDFTCTALGVSASCVSDLNTISLFAGNLVFDSSNKNNSDLYRSTFVSADSNVQNDLVCTVQSLNQSDINSCIVNCDAFNQVNNNTDVKYIHYMHCYNQLAPALVTTNNVTDAHEEANSHIPDIGLQYCDLLFFEAGIQVGTNTAVANLSTSRWYNIYSRTPYSAMVDYYGPGDVRGSWPLSGIYLNYPAQTSACDASTTTAYNAYKTNHFMEYDMWFIDKVYDTAFATTGQTVTANAYVSKQLLLYPSHYPLYRGRFSVSTTPGDGSQHVSIARKDYLLAPVRVPTAHGEYESPSHFGQPTNLVSDAFTYITVENKKQHPGEKNSNYIYTYSAKPVYIGVVKPVELTLTYNDAFFTATSEIETVQTTETEAIALLNQKVSSANENRILTTSATKCYAVSSNSYDGLIDKRIASEIINLSTIEKDINLTARYDEEEGMYNVFKFDITAPDNYTLTFPNVSTFLECTARIHGDMMLDPRYYILTPEAETQSITIVSDQSDMHKYDAYDSNERHVSLASATSITADIELSPTETVQKIFYVNVNLHPTITPKQVAHETEDTTLSANSLVFSYSPTRKDIVKVLDSDLYEALTCTGLSADDLQYVLITDKQYRPVMDIALETTAVDNNGYIIDFNPLVTGFSGISAQLANTTNTRLYSLTVSAQEDKSKGMAINIENGNE